MSEIRKLFPAQIKDAGARSIIAVVSTESVDRDGDVIHASGWQLDNFRRNPVVLFGHDYSRPPVARASSIDVVGTTLRATIEFPPPNVSELADEVHGLVRAGFLPGVSVGFRPLPGGKTYNEQRGGMDFTAQELLEFSFVAIPSNPQALVIQRTNGGDRMARWLTRSGIGAPGSQNPTIGPPTECPRTARGDCPNRHQSANTCPDRHSGCPLSSHAHSHYGGGRARGRPGDLVELSPGNYLLLDEEVVEFHRAILTDVLGAMRGEASDAAERAVAHHSGRVLP